jgi:AbrB family looped-hinge helix DNA binding protein
MNEHARISARSTLTSKGQTTVPKEVREALRMSEGVQIDWIVDEGKATATVKPRTLRAVDLAGILGKPPSGRHLTIEEMNKATGRAVSNRFRRKTQR